jgi:SAM-dependent methyltransferase
MGHRECFAFGERYLSEGDIAKKDIVEVGSHEDGGSMRPYIQSFHPKSYVGIDIQTGPGVDLVCDAMELLEKLGHRCCDVVIAVELLEHIREWQKIVHIFKSLLREDGVIIITTRSRGFPFHYAPFDFWRYEVEDMEAIFSDFEIIAIEQDTREVSGHVTPGVFVAAKKPKTFVEKSISNHALYSIIMETRILSVSNWNILWYEINRLGFRYLLKHNALPFLMRDAIAKYLTRPIKAFLTR